MRQQKRQSLKYIDLFCVVFLYNAVINADFAFAVTLLPSSVDELEMSNVTLKCLSEGSQYVKWIYNTKEASIQLQNGECKTYPNFLTQNPNLYSYSCTDNEFTLTLKNISRLNHNAVWRCQIFNGTANLDSNSITVRVKVPVTTSTIGSYNNLLTEKENIIISLTCTTSTCRPEPKFKWYKEKNVMTILEQTTVGDNPDSNIQPYINQFSINLTRDLNGSFLFCAAENQNNSSVLSNKILVIVTYPPDGPPRISNLTNKGEFRVLQNDLVRLECLVTGGNPLPSLEWVKYNDSPQQINGNTVTKTTSWQATGRDAVDLTCQSFQTHRNDSVHITVNILYPPDKPEISIETSSGIYEIVDKTISVIEGRTFKLNCSAKSNPPVSFKWNDLTTDRGNVYTAMIDRHTQSISCYVQNEMRFSDSRASITGYNTTRLNVHVLYPPTVNKMADRSVNEGEDVVYTCNFEPGNPSVTNVTWSWNDTIWNDKKLTISNVTKHHQGIYRCDVRYSMVSSDGNKEFGNASGEFFLYVKSNTNEGTTAPSSSASLAVAGAVGGAGSVAILISVITLVVVYKKRQQKKKQDVSSQLIDLNNHKEGYMELIPNDHEQSSSQPERQQTRIEDVHGLQELDDYDENLKTDYGVYGNAPDVIKKIERVDVVELVPYLTDKTAEFFAADYAKLPQGLTKPYEFSQRPENIALNRYHGIYPYDHSRVKIPSMPDYFINACYIDGYKNKKAYIASLGPLSRTSNRFVMFWQMVWSEKSDVIVMLTKLTEPSGVKCDQYWPKDGVSEAYGEVTVTSAGEEVYSDYVVRKFSLLKGGQKRNLKHFHFMAWPDKSVPEDVTCILEFRRSVRANHSSGPLIVHCSAGIGRTGTLIAIDILTEEGQKKGSVNVFECVKKMRDQRINMVQTLDQYYYVYKTLANALVFDNEAITAEKIHKYVETSKPNRFSDMFKTFNLSVESENTIENNSRNAYKVLKDKNRAGSDIPGDAHRVRLFLNRGMEASDYINAVYLNSFTVADHFIAAQSPLPNSVEDFLCLIYQENCCCVVSMDGEQARQSTGSYVPPDNSNFTAGSYSVHCSRLDTKETYIVRKLKIEVNGQIKGAEKVVYHFQFLGWLDGNKVPNDPRQFVEFTEDVERFAGQFGTEGSHVLVHCLNAFERSCLFCAVIALIEKIKHEKEVCIPNTLRQIRTRRKLAIPTLEQFKFCFQAADAFVSKEKAGTNNAENSYMNVTMT